MREYRTVKIADINTGDRFIDPGDDELPKLVADIKAHGLQTPILVDQDLTLIDGLRRMEAYKPGDEVDVVVTDSYVDTLEVMLKDKDNPFTRHWTTRRIWDMHRSTEKQRWNNHHNAVRLNLNHFKGKTPPLPKTIRDLLGTTKKVSLSRDVIALLSGYTASALQTVHYIYARAYGLKGELTPELQALASDLVKRLDQGYNVYSARGEWNRAATTLKPRIVSESEQRQILRNAALSASSTGKIVTDVNEINDDISVEEAATWLRAFVQARSDYYSVIKKLRERVRKG